MANNRSKINSILCDAITTVTECPLDIALIYSLKMLRDFRVSIWDGILSLL
ncbi:MAG: hypothetical protein QXP91_13085 [Candidatus Methanomethylicia archaeon]